MRRSPARPVSDAFAAPLFVMLVMSACGGAGGETSDPPTSTVSTGDTGTSTGVPTTGDSSGGSSGSGQPGSSGGSSTDAETSTGAVGSTGGASSESGAASESGGPSESGGTSESGESSDSGGAAGAELRVLQLNLCHSGVAGCFKGDAVMTKAVAVITEVAPGLVTLNEVCRGDVPWLAAQTGAIDHRFTPALRADDSPVKCKNGEDYGNGLLSWVAPTWAEPVTGVYAKQSSMSERRVWICMGYAGFVGCTTHLSTEGATALAQCKELVGGALATAAADGPAVMAGDWNLKFKGSPNAQDCVPGGFYRKGDGAVQHVIASDDLAFLETIVIDMQGTTDHPGLEVRVTLP